MGKVVRGTGQGQGRGETGGYEEKWRRGDVQRQGRVVEGGWEGACGKHGRRVHGVEWFVEEEEQMIW